MDIEKAILEGLRRQYGAHGFEFLYQRLDTLHDFAMEGRLTEATDLPAEEVIGWLKELIYIARETVTEIEARDRAVTALFAKVARERGWDGAMVTLRFD
ncbi:MAG: hypothetical protein HY260_18420 [Chloroflexi bacterium]|nr:hypothetical protein [Chloroflexota bacterium]